MAAFTKYQYMLLALFSVSFTVTLLSWSYLYGESFAKPRTSPLNSTKFILYWTPFWHKWDYFWGSRFEPFETCAYSNCYATSNRTLLPLEHFDVLIFHPITYDKTNLGVPWVRTRHQRYVFMDIEAPIHICPNLHQYSSYFNWTMTYRFDSDIVRRHGNFFRHSTDYSLPSNELLKQKTKLVAWFVSHCHTDSKRELLVRELQKFIPVDVFGKCGPLKCKTTGKVSSPECYNMLEQTYKFYLAFENSYCRDYSTEKLYKVLEKNIVPVVYGAGDYHLSAPPNSVINVEDFDSAQELAFYLKYLDKNDAEYLKYFEWKKHYNITTSPVVSACEICQKLHEPTYESVYHDLNMWWWEKDKSICKTGKLLPKIVSSLL